MKQFLYSLLLPSLSCFAQVAIPDGIQKPASYSQVNEPLSYDIHFIGLEDEAAIKSILDVSDLVTIQNRPPKSINGLRYRIASDIPSMLKVLKAYGYYEATITSDINTDQSRFIVSIYIQPGPQYSISSYQVFQGDCTVPAEIENCGKFLPEDLGLTLGSPALSTNIVNTELNLLSELANCGYPLATVEKRRVIVDMASKEVEASTCINEGPLSHFGPISIFGLSKVKSQFILRRINWEEGTIYNTDDVLETQKRLLNTNLFSSVMISHDDALGPHNELPMKLSLTESKYQQISLGVYYATVDGFGGMFNWTHRNLRGLGEILSINGEFSQRYLLGSISYKKPDFLRLDQDLRTVASIDRENIRPYTSFNYSGASYIERKFNKNIHGTFGLQVKHFNVTNSASNGTYLLMGLPLFVKYSTANDLLNPTRGITVVYQGIPYQSLFSANQQFYKQMLTTQFYIPMGTDNCVFATRIQLGSIAGTNQQHVPLPVLFLGGSEDDLRGYRYKTVSPLDSNDKPLGGRGALYITCETRFRIYKETIGLVPFADFGTVSLDQIPKVNTFWFKSLGLGLRYFTFFGPIRADIGFPLNRREGIDPLFRIYASIGQTF